MKIDISKYYYNKCKKFATDRIDSSKKLYAYRGEQKKDKMIEDIIIGTLGEWGAYKYLISKSIKVGSPDMKIYKNKRKSFAADLKSDEYNFHVKSQSKISLERYGASWLFQRSDYIIKEPGCNDYIIMTSLDNSTVEILGIVKASDIVEGNLFRECKVYTFRFTKVALYLNDLVGAGLDLNCF